MSTNFNKENLEALERAITTIKQICSREHLPMFISVGVKNDESGTTYRNDMVSPETLDISLADNKFPKFVNVTLGFDTVQPIEQIELDF